MVDGGGDGTELAAVKAMKVGLPTAPALPLDRLGFRDVGEGVGGTANLVPCAPAPHLYLIWHCTVGAHQPLMGWAPPSGRESRA